MNAVDWCSHLRYSHGRDGGRRAAGDRPGLPGSWRRIHGMDAFKDSMSPEITNVLGDHAAIF
jgi:hypothetical protein